MIKGEYLILRFKHWNIFDLIEPKFLETRCMNKRVWLLITAGLGLFNLDVFAQASDAPGLPYHVPTIMEIIEEAVEQPTDTNAFVQMLFEHEDFPKVKLGAALTEQKKEAIQEWVETHVPEMQEFQWQRKVNYDKFYLNQQ